MHSDVIVMTLICYDTDPCKYVIFYTKFSHRQTRKWMHDTKLPGYLKWSNFLHWQDLLQKGKIIVISACPKCHKN